MARLFFALRPPEEAALKLAAVAESLAAVAAGKPVPHAKIHMTLAFLGDLGAERIEPARRVASALPHRGFEVVLDRVGSFRSARVAWAGCRAMPEELASLQEALTRGLRESGFDLEERAFTPHLTLVRKISAPVRAAAMKPLAWKAREMLLMRSELGTGQYSTLESWPLD